MRSARSATKIEGGQAASDPNVEKKFAHGVESYLCGRGRCNSLNPGQRYTGELQDALFQWD
jgi:hypothetical protein